MSVHAAKWAWSQDCPSPTAKLVLMALADHANADGECWPTMKTVAELAGVSQRSVHNHVKALETAGLVERVERRMHGGQFRGWTFRLAMSTSGSQLPVEGDCQRQSEVVASGSRLPLPVAASFRSRTVSEPSGTVSRRDELFEAIAEACGINWRRLTKPARGELNAAVKELRAIDVTAADVGPAARAYRREWPNATLTPSALAKHAPRLLKDMPPEEQRCSSCRRPLSAPDHDELCEVFA